MAALTTPAAAADVSASLPPDHPSWETHLATPEELEQISQMKVELGTALTEGRHAAFPEVVGDISLLRYLRGFDHSVEEACKIFRKHIEVRAEYNLDDVRDRMVYVFENNPMFGQTDLRHGQAWADHAPSQLSAGHTPRGHVIIYLPVGDADTRSLTETITEEQILETYLDDLILRQIQVDRLSRKYNCLIKLLLIIDCAGLTLRAVNHSEFQKGDRQRNDDIRQYTHVEYVGRIIVINTPWIARRFWGLIKHTVPKRTRQRVFLYGSDYRQHIMDQVSLRTLSTLATFRKSKEMQAEGDGTTGGICTGLSKSEPIIPAGKTHEVMIEVDPSDTALVRWKFEVTSRDIRFSVGKFVMGTGDKTDAGSVGVGTSEQIIEEERQVSASDGVVEGTHEVISSGLLTVRFSNKHSWMRSNSVRYEVEKTLKAGKSDAADRKLE